MKKRGIALLLAAVTAAMSFAGCGTETETESASGKGGKNTSDGLVSVGGLVEGQRRMAAENV